MKPLIAIPREQNQQAEALACVASTLKAPTIPKLKHEVDMRYQTSIPDNIRHWHVFKDYQQIKRFLDTVDI